jgi:hypothetical protein
MVEVGNCFLQGIAGIAFLFLLYLSIKRRAKMNRINNPKPPKFKGEERCKRKL